MPFCVIWQDFIIWLCQTWFFFFLSWIHKLFKNMACVVMQNTHRFWVLKRFVTACNFFGYKKITSKGWTLVAKRVRARVCVCVVQWKKVPDEWQARQATPAILQVSSRKHNAKKITTSVCVCVPSVSALDWWGYCLVNMWIEREYNVEKTGGQTERKTDKLAKRDKRERERERERERSVSLKWICVCRWLS